MDWDDLQTFLVIAREGSLSAAAKALRTTQPTMGRRLAKMEQKIGARLLERHPKGYSLTNLGEQVLGNVERIEAEVLATERTVSGRDIALEGVVRVTSVDVLTSRILVNAVAALQIEHPKIQVELLPDQRSLSLSKREADIAVRLAQFEAQELITKKLGTMENGFFASKEYIDLHGMPNTQNSAQHSIVNVLEDQMHFEEAKNLVIALPHARTAIRTNSRETMFAACKAGIGICSLPRIRASVDSNLIDLDLGVPNPKRDVWLGVHQDMRHMPRVRVVIDAIVAEFQKFKNEKQ